MDTVAQSPVCVIGAGPCGLTALKNLRQCGVEAFCLEAQPFLGGNWRFGSPHSSVCSTTHMISSKRLTEFCGFPMPKSLPPFPHHAEALEYLQSYAEAFELEPHIEFNRRVEEVAPGEKGWLARVAGESQPRRCRAVVIANGHHWDPIWPESIEGFTGEVLHARQYKTPEQLAGRRVLVIGAGNSGCDIACEAGRIAERAALSMRRGYHFLPKFLFGKPVDQCGERLHRWRLPRWAQRWISAWAVHVAVGPLERYGLPRPDHHLFETHPIVNSQLLYHVGHGLVRVRPGVERCEGREVTFADGTREAFDLIVCATGYKLSFPFIDVSHLNWRAGRPDLYLNVFHPTRDDLFVVGMIQPNSGIWGLADLQSQLVGHFLSDRPGDAAGGAALRRAKRAGADDLSGGIRYLDSPRHRIEVEYYSYRQRLRSLLRTWYGVRVAAP